MIPRLNWDLGSYCVVDLETTIRNKDVGNNKAAPWHPDNFVVAAGMTRGGRYEHLYTTTKYSTVGGIPLWGTARKPIVLVGHNVKFDLHYLLQDELWALNEWPHIYVWDTMLAEYLLSGQTQMFPSLDYCSKKYGGTLKDDKIKGICNFRRVCDLS